MDLDTADGVFETKVKSAITIMSNLKSFFDSLSTYAIDTSIDNFDTYKSNVDEFLADSVGFGDKIAGLSENLSGINPFVLVANTTAATSAASIISGFLVSLSGLDIETSAKGIKGWFADSTKQETIFQSIESFGRNVGMAGQALSGLGAEGSSFESDIEVGLKAVRSVVALITELESTKIQDPDVGGSQVESFKNALKYISTFATELQRYSNITEGVDYSSLANFTTVIANLKTIMSGTGDDALTSENFVKGLDPQVVITKLSEFVTQVSAGAQEQANLLSQSTSQFNQSGSGLIDSMASGISGSDAASDAVSGAISKAASSGTQYQGKFKGLGLYLALGLSAGIKSGGGIVSNAVAEIVRKGIEAGKKEGEVASPSRATMEIGKFLSLGLAVGITKYGNAVTKSSEDVTSDSINTLGGMFDTIGSLAADDINTQPIISPVVDTSNVRMASGYIDGMFGDRSFGVRSTVMASSMAGSTDLATRTPKFGSPDVVNAVKDMNDRIGTLGDAISSMQMVVDTGALVGQVANKMDQKLGVIAARKGRLG